MNRTVVQSAITQFIISAGGALAVVLVDNAQVSTKACAAAILVGLVAAAKDWRSSIRTSPSDAEDMEIAKSHVERLRSPKDTE